MNKCFIDSGVILDNSIVWGLLLSLVLMQKHETANETNVETAYHAAIAKYSHNNNTSVSMNMF